MLATHVVRNLSYRLAAGTPSDENEDAALQAVIPDIFNRESSVFACYSVREDAGRHAGRPLQDSA